MGSHQNNTLEFLMLVGKLKTVKRTGWVNHNISEPESVADHMYRMAMMTFLLSDQPNMVDTQRCLKLAVVHDLAECIVGDITPSDPMGKEEKHRREKEAMDYLGSLVSPEIGKELLELYQEYESQETVEAKTVKDLDRFEMILQAFEYEKVLNPGTMDVLVVNGDFAMKYLLLAYNYCESRHGELEDFFHSTRGKFTSGTIKEWVEELYALRAKFNQKPI